MYYRLETVLSAYTIFLSVDEIENEFIKFFKGMFFWTFIKN